MGISKFFMSLVMVLSGLNAVAQETTTQTTTEAPAAEAAATQTAESSDDANVKGIEKMQVTGSHIRRTDVEGPSPVLVIDRQQIEASGFNSVGAILRRSTVSPFGGGGSSVNLKGIGSARTLILVNGQRAPGSGSSYTGGAVSANFVPIAAVERIEVLKDGASATYGSDALGGVVNIITRKDINGLAFVNQYNYSEFNGGDSNRMALAYGDQSSKSNFMTSLQARWFQGQRSSDVDYAKELNSSFVFSGNYFGDAGISPAPNCTRFDESGRCAELVSDKQRSFDGYSLDSVTQYSRSLGGEMELYTSLIVGYDYGKDQFPNVLNTPGVGIGLNLTAAETPAAWDTNLPNYSNTDTRIWHRFDDYVNTSITQNYYGGLVTGVKGYFGDTDWMWDASLNNQININETQEEQLATLSGARAAIIGGSYDPFDTNVRNTNGLGIDAFNRNRANVHWLEAKANGGLGSFLGFDWASALGVSAAHFAYADHRADAILQGDVMLQSGTAGRGARELYSLFAEFGGTIGKEFELQLSIRGDEYSDFGNTFNPKIAAFYQPANWLKFRTSAGTGFQAPTLQDVNARLEGYNFLVDQVRCKDPAFGNNNPGSSDCQTQSISFFKDVSPDLKEETSISVNLGTIVEPTKNFWFSVDWWYVKVEDTIGVNLDDILQLEQEGTAPSKYGVNVIRDGGSPTGRIERIEYTLFNVGTEEADGIDFQMNYKIPTTIGDFNLNNEFVYMNHYHTTFYEEFGKQQVLGQFGLPRWKNNVTLGYSHGQISTQIVARSVADMEKNVRGLGKTVSPTQWDAFFSYDPEWSGVWEVGGFNLFNIRPRFDTTTSSRINGSNFQRQQTFYVRYRQDF